MAEEREREEGQEERKEEAKGGGKRSKKLYLKLALLWIAGFLIMVGAMSLLGTKIIPKPEERKDVLCLLEATLAEREKAEFMMKTISARVQELEEFRKVLEDLKSYLKAEKEEVESRRSEVASIEKQINSLLGQVDKARQAQIKKLAAVYASMKPEELKGILRGLDEQTIVAILLQMRERDAAKVLAAMDADRAARISQMMAGKGGVARDGDSGGGVDSST